MPVIEVHLLEGYSPKDHQRVGEALTDAIRLVVPAPPDAITVLIHQLRKDHYYRGRTTRSPAQALPEPDNLVHQFLTCLGAQDLEGAQMFLADEFSLHFPGTAAMHSLEELVQWSASRYYCISKTFNNTEIFAAENGNTIVYCHGSLSGEWPDGTPFANIRFIDRFELVGGKISRQDVWNDLAENRYSKDL